MRLCLQCLFLPAYLFLVPVSLRAQHNQGLEVDRVVIRGNQAISTDDIITVLGFESGNVFDRHTLDQNINRMLHAYADQGYLWTEITSLDIQFSPDSSAVSFTLHIREGPVVYCSDSSEYFVKSNKLAVCTGLGAPDRTGVGGQLSRQSFW